MQAFPVAFLILVSLCLLLYRYASRYKDFWKDQNVPYEKLSLFFGVTARFMLKPFHLVEEELCRKHGRVFGSFEDGYPVLYVAEPDLLKTVFVKEFATLTDRRTTMKFGHPLLDNMMVFAPSAQWRRLRTSTSPAFTTGRLRKMNDLIAACAQEMCEKLKIVESHAEEDIKMIYTHYTLSAISGCVFGAKFDAFTENSCQIANAGQCPFFTRLTFPIMLQVLRQRFYEELHIKRFNVPAFDFFKGLVTDMIKIRAASQRVSTKSLPKGQEPA